MRHARGLSLTEDGDRLLTSAQEVANRVEAISCDRPAPQALAGTVRISAAEPIGVHAARGPELARVLPELSLPGIEMWLVMHRELRGHGTVRAVHERLAGALSQYVQTPGPEPYR